jgi:hypothetical protein
VHAVGPKGDCYVRAVVDYERDFSLLAGLEDRSCQTQHVAGLCLLFAQLYQIDAGRDELGHQIAQVPRC